jgi:hypothetical protein
VARQGEFRRRRRRLAKRHQDCEKANDADHETRTFSKVPAGSIERTNLFECGQYEYTSTATPLIGKISSSSAETTY